MDVSDDELTQIYLWVDGIPLSRPKKNISRDFSDGVLAAEIVSHFFPRLVELHNYSGTHNTAQKSYNWNTLNTKVFKKLNFMLSEDDIRKLVQAEPGTIERVLKLMRLKMEAARGGSGELAGGAPMGVPMPAAGRKGAQYEDARAQYAGSPATVPAPPPYPAPGLNARAAQPVVVSPQNGQGQAPGQFAPAHRSRGAGSADTAAMASALAQKDALIAELQQTGQILETKVRKLEQLVRLKDAKIATLVSKLSSLGVA